MGDAGFQMFRVMGESSSDMLMSRSTLSAIFLGTEIEALAHGYLFDGFSSRWKRDVSISEMPIKRFNDCRKLFSPYCKAFKSRSKYAVLRLGMSSNIAGVG